MMTEMRVVDCVDRGEKFSRFELCGKGKPGQESMAVKG
jgi:hypothetical protein